MRLPITKRRQWMVLFSLGMSLGLGCCLASTASAQVQLDRFFPSAVARGQQTIIQAEGKFETWPANIVKDRDTIDVTAGEKAGELTLNVSADEPPGVLWVRLWDQESASDWMPILIASSAVNTESEPNDQLNEAMRVEMPVSLTGRLEKNRDADLFRFAATAGQTVVASLTAHQVLRSPMDAILQILDQQGNVLAQSDDVHGLDPQIVFQPPHSGEFAVRLFAFPEAPNSTIGSAGGAAFVYVLNLTAGSFMDHALPLSGDGSALAGTSAGFGWNLNDGQQVVFAAATRVSPPVTFLKDAVGWQWQAMPTPPLPASVENPEAGDPPLLPLPVVYSGHLNEPNEVDRVQVQASANVRYKAAITSRSRGFPLDASLQVVDTVSGKVIAEKDDASRNEFDPVLEFSVPEDSLVELRIEDMARHGGPYSAYALSIAPTAPEAQLSLAADHYRMVAGESLEIPVAIARQHGFDTPLQIAIEGLPAGVQCEPVSSKDEKSVTLKLTAAAEADFQGEIQVVASLLNTEGQPLDKPGLAAVHLLRPLLPIDRVWLSVVKAAATGSDK